MPHYILLLALLLPGLAAAECRHIDQLPARIDEPGCYLLVVSAELALPNGYAIAIESDDVTLDLGGHVLTNTAGAGNTANGIAAYRRANLVVRNGTLRGFATGVALGMDKPSWGVGGYTVENLQLFDSTLFGVDLRGHWVHVRGNRVMHSGGNALDGREGSATGIYVQGSMVTIVDNDVLNVVGELDSTTGILVAGAHAGVVEGNRVLGVGHGIVAYGDAVTCRDNSFGEIGQRSLQCAIDGGGNAGQMR